MNPQNLASLFQQTVDRFPNKKALVFKENGRLLGLTWAELAEKVHCVASALAEKGLKSGDRIAILSENRPEWACVDLAAQYLGLVTVPIYTSLTPAEIQYILSDCGASAVAVSNKTFFEKLASVQRALPALRWVLGFDASLTLSQKEISVPLYLIKEFEKFPPDAKDLDRRRQAISADALASLIYTSGTTGFPKGVMLSHANFIHNALYCQKALKMDATDAHLSFLPLSHVFERLAGYYLMISIGATISYAENMETVAQNMLEMKPTFILGVPRFYEKIQERVLETLKKSSSFKRGLFFWAKDLGARKRQSVLARRKEGWLFNGEHRLAEFLVYRKFKKRLGGRIRFCVSGGAPLSKEVAEFFADLGVLILEGYGLSETAPVISANREEKYKFGSVGIPLDGVEVRITEEGEIATKSACVMKGYWNKPEETQAVLRDGWFYTGDLGQIDKDGFLSITGRKKELIVTSGGKKVAPRAIEEALEKDAAILRAVLFGEGKKFITALIVPQEEKLLEYAHAQKIAYQDYPELLKNPKIYEWMDQKVQALGRDLANYEKIKYFALLENDFSQAAGELTPTLKVKREVVLSRYKEKLLPFYEKVD